MNNFEIDNNHYIQLHGTAISTRMVPVYAKLFMVCTHGEDKREEFISHVNSLHSTIRFTHKSTNSNEIPQRETVISIEVSDLSSTS